MKAKVRVPGTVSYPRGSKRAGKTAGVEENP